MKNVNEIDMKTAQIMKNVNGIDMKSVNGMNMYKVRSHNTRSLEEAILEFPMGVENNDSKYKNETMVIALNRLYQYEKSNLMGIFTENEAYLIVTALVELKYQPWYQDKEILIMMVNDGAIYEDYDEYFNVDMEELDKKLQKLNDFQCFSLIRMAYEVLGKGYGSPEMEKIIKEIFGIN